MANKVLRVVLDSNILISAYVFGGKPEVILRLLINQQFQAVSSPSLITEFLEVLRKKFGVSDIDLLEIENEIKDLFEIVYPPQTLTIFKDIPDNRLLEAAIEGNCDFIISGDQKVLNLSSYKSIKILTAEEFLKNYHL